VIDDLATFLHIGPAPSDRPWVVLSMIASVDGAATIDGRSGPLGNATDQQVLRLVRAAADVVLVGAATVRAERYRPLRAPKRLVVVSRTGDLGDTDGLGAAPTTELVRPAPGDTDVDLATLLRRLAGQVVVAEGGPSLNGQLLAAGLVDEVFVTLSPRFVGGDADRIATGPTTADPEPWELRHVLHDDGYLFLRYRSRRSSSARVRSAGTSS